MSNNREGEKGVCPKCGLENLNYGDSELTDVGLYYLYTCNDCGFKGQEWYKLVFTDHTDKNGQGLKHR